MSETLSLGNPKLKHLYIAPKLKHVYSDVTYQIKGALIVITDWNNNNVKDVHIMRNIHSKIKQYWRNLDEEKNCFYFEKPIHEYLHIQ